MVNTAEEKQNVFEKRRSVRRYTNEIVSDKIIYELIETGIQAPSATNVQGWKFIILDDLKLLRELSKESGNTILRMVHQAILVMYDNEMSQDEYTRNNQIKAAQYYPHIQSGAACIENILLKATELGIGACWMTLLPSKDRVRNMLNIPNSIEIIALITIGYPAHRISKLERKISPDICTYHNNFEERYIYDKK